MQFHKKIVKIIVGKLGAGSTRGNHRFPSIKRTGRGSRAKENRRMKRGRRSTPPGQHRAVMLEEVLHVLDVQPGAVVVDATVGWAGHAVELLRRAGPEGRLIGLDLDAENLPKARERLSETSLAF